MPINLFGGKSLGDGDSEKLGGGKIHPGFAVNNKPYSLEAWKFSTDDPDVAESALAAFGYAEDEDAAKALKVDGFNQVIEGGSEDNVRYEVYSATNKLEITVQPGGIGTSLVLWKPDNSGKVAETDGTHLIEDGVLTDTISPLTDGKTLDEIFHMGFKPNLRLNFTIVGHEDLGSFVLFNGARTALENFAQRERELDEIDATVTTTVELEFVKSKRGGFRRPKIGPLTHAESEAADDNDSTPTKSAAKAAAKPAAKKATRKRATK